MSGGAVAAAAAIANAIKANGVLVRVTPADFKVILGKVDKPLVVCAKCGVFSTKYQYLVSYKGFAFFTKSVEPIVLPGAAETIAASRIWIPG